MPVLTRRALDGPLQAMARGPEHPRLGAIASSAVDPCLAGAISAGARMKVPPSVEPNEDGFLLRRDAGRVGLVVVDGAGGFAAAAAVLASIESALPALMREPAPATTVTAAWAAALAARDRVQAADHTNRPHVAVSLALVDADGSTWCATTGDTAVLAVEGATVQLLTGVAPHLDHTAPLPQPQRSRVGPDAVLVGVSDGFFDALGARWVEVLRHHVTQVGRDGAAEVAERLVGDALRAGGPDHVTVVVHARSAP